MDILFYIYLACFIVGGVVVLLSALGGAGGDMGVDADAVDLGESLGLLSFLSTRKVFFFGCFFGLMGLGGRAVDGHANDAAGVSGGGRVVRLAGRFGNPPPG